MVHFLCWQTTQEAFCINSLPYQNILLTKVCWISLFNSLFYLVDFCQDCVVLGLHCGVNHSERVKLVCRFLNYYLDRCLRLLGIGHLAPRSQDLVEKSRALRIISALDDKISAKYKSHIAARRIRVVSPNVLSLYLPFTSFYLCILQLIHITGRCLYQSRELYFGKSATNSPSPVWMFIEIACSIYFMGYSLPGLFFSGSFHISVFLDSF